MKLFDSICAAPAFGISLFAATAVVAKYYVSAPYGDDTKIPCQDWVNGIEESIGGFQAAPAYKMQSKWREMDHRCNNILVKIAPDCTMFYNQDYDTSLRIYGFKC